LKRELAQLDGWVTKPFAPIGNAQSRATAQSALSGLGYTGSGISAAIEWTWSCPQHPDVRESDRGKCSRCGEKLIPTKKD
jgi:hypothetical protein